ncbi:hypothetical protein ACQPX6_10240 [Actinomycetospora sp. CA-101289]|uniref:hypothetical protein n=1 Tax=Actinomycetospora sp. CA-101289 TaxID=3239893 RepID=UPI003D9761DD
MRRRPGTDVTGTVTVGRLHELSDDELEEAKRWHIPGEDPVARLPDIYAEEQRRAAERLTRAALRLTRWNMIVAVTAIIVAATLGIIQIVTAG